MSKSEILLPTPSDFTDWAEQCRKILGRPRSSYLRNDTPGDDNRYRAFLGAKTTFDMIKARQVQVELHQDADRLGIELPKLKCERVRAE